MNGIPLKFVLFCFNVGMSPNRIGSDLRCLYALGALDDYELLKKQVAESNSILAAMDTLLRERLCAFRGASPSQVYIDSFWFVITVINISEIFFGFAQIKFYLFTKSFWLGPGITHCHLITCTCFRALSVQFSQLIICLHTVLCWRLSVCSLLLWFPLFLSGHRNTR